MSRHRSYTAISYFLIIFAALSTAVSANAQKPEYDSASSMHPKTSYRFSYTPIYQFETDLDIGGSLDVQRHFLRFDATGIINRHWIVGLGLSLDYERWDFSGIESLAGIDLWDEIVRPGISAPIIYSNASNWRLMLIPSIEFAGATGAETSKSLSYGTVLAAMHTFGPNLMIGLGAGVFNRLDEWKGFPFLAIDWKINDQFRLSNPFQAGLAGPAGLELIYMPSSRWDVGVGGAYRSYRFRLDDSSMVADGIGQLEFFSAFLRVGVHMANRMSLDLNGGVLFEGEISIDNENGHDLGETDTDTAPYIGVTFRGEF
jgi:hypothetical protein